MKKIILFGIISLLLLSIVSANGDDDHSGEDHQMDMAAEMASNMEGMDHSMHERISFLSQFSMVLPFSHFSAGRWWAGSIIILLWLGFFCGLLSQFSKGKK
jgi:hypothetical protein